MGVYVINLDEYADVGTHWIALFCYKSEIVYFDSFGADNVPGEIKEFIGNKNIKANIFRVQANNSIMWEHFCIGFIDFALAGKKLTDFTSFQMDISSSIRHRFAIEIPRGKFVEITHRFWKANPRGNYNIDSTWKFRRVFDFQNRRNIDEFSTWIFLCHFDVKST